jgi:hypothetical protein
LIRQGFAEHHSFIFPVAQENLAILMPLYYMQFLFLCVPIALFWYVFQAAQRHLTNRWPTRKFAILYDPIPDVSKAWFHQR